MANQKTSLNMFLGDTTPSLLAFSGDSLLIYLLIYPSTKEGTDPLSALFDADHVALSMHLLSETTLYTAVLDYVRTPIDLEFREREREKKSFSSLL